jgi:hypothetical protein
MQKQRRCCWRINMRGHTPHVPAIAFASLPGSGLVTQIWRLCLPSAPEAEPRKQHSQVEPGNELTWERASWGVIPPNRFANRISEADTRRKVASQRYRIAPPWGGFFMGRVGRLAFLIPFLPYSIPASRPIRPLPCAMCKRYFEPRPSC